MAGNNPLEERYDKALAALMSEPTIRAAAKKLDIAEPTLYKWLRDPIFSSMYREARMKAVEHAIAKLHKGTNIAVDRLLHIIQDGEQPAAVQVAAARAVLEYSFRGLDVMSLLTKLEELDALVGELRADKSAIGDVPYVETP